MAFNIHPLHRSKSNLTRHSQDILEDFSPFPVGPGAVIDHSILPPFPVLGRGLEYVERLILLAADREDTICALRKMVHRLMNTGEWSRRSCTTSSLLRSHGCGNRRHRLLGHRKRILRLPGRRRDCTSVLAPRVRSRTLAWDTSCSSSIWRRLLRPAVACCPGIVGDRLGAWNRHARRRVDGRRSRRFIERAT